MPFDFKGLLADPNFQAGMAGLSAARQGVPLGDVMAQQAQIREARRRTDLEERRAKLSEREYDRKAKQLERDEQMRRAAQERWQQAHQVYQQTGDLGQFKASVGGLLAEQGNYSGAMGLMTPESDNFVNVGNGMVFNTRTQQFIRSPYGAGPKDPTAKANVVFVGPNGEKRRGWIDRYNQTVKFEDGTDVPRGWFPIEGRSITASMFGEEGLVPSGKERREAAVEMTDLKAAYDNAGELLNTIENHPALVGLVGKGIGFAGKGLGNFDAVFGTNFEKVTNPQVRQDIATGTVEVLLNLRQLLVNKRETFNRGEQAMLDELVAKASVASTAAEKITAIKRMRDFLAGKFERKRPIAEGRVDIPGPLNKGADQPLPEEKVNSILYAPGK